MASNLNDIAQSTESATEPVTIRAAEPELTLQPSGSTRVRVMGALLALTLLAPLATARCLVPNSEGLGTHQQLGLPPCSMRFMFGIRCPACGMTTSWSHFTRGDFGASLRVNAGGAALAVIASAIIILGMQSAGSGRWPSDAAKTSVSVALVATGAVTIADWLIRLFA